MKQDANDEGGGEDQNLVAGLQWWASEQLTGDKPTRLEASIKIADPRKARKQVEVELSGTKDVEHKQPEENVTAQEYLIDAAKLEEELPPGVCWKQQCSISSAECCNLGTSNSSNLGSAGSC